MKSRKNFTLLAEKKGEKAHKEAIAMGLKYGGFGYWKDPQTGETTHKTENDQLVPVEADQESELADKRGEDGSNPPGQMPGMPGGDPQQGRGGTQNPRGPGTPTLGQKVGTAEPGKEQEELHDRQTWIPGPDGDHCVDSAHPPGDIPDDAFVGKTNYYQWTAGPDGTNYQNVSYDNIMKAGKEQSGQGDQTAQEPAGMQEETEPDGAKTMMGKMMARKVPGQSQPTMRNANLAIKQMGQHDDSEGRNPALARQVASMMRIRDRGKQHSQQNTVMQKGEKQADMWRKGLKLPAIAKDTDAVAAMNAEAKKLVQDPDFDMASEDAFDGGAFGEVGFSKTDPNIVIKKGGIGPDELKALHAMRDHPGFPTLINAQFDEPFTNKSSVHNNEYGGDEAREPNQSQYWDPDEAQEFEDRFPTARGTFAMTAADGEPLANMVMPEDDFAEGGSDEMNGLREKVWALRAALHQAGFSHNDTHGGNIFVNEDMEPTMLDMGLAKDNPLSALMEGLGATGQDEDDDPIMDYQFDSDMRWDKLPAKMKETMLENREELEQMIMDNGDIDMEDEEEMEWKMSSLGQLMQGGIRMRGKDMEGLQEAFPALKNKDLVMKMIRRLYQGMGGSGVERRMASAFDQRAKDSKLLATVNKMRKQKGKKELSNPNRVVPMKNLDFDD